MKEELSLIGFVTSKRLSQNNRRWSYFSLFHTHFFNASSINPRSSFNSSSVNPYTLPSTEGFSIFKPYFTPPVASLWAEWQLQIVYSFLVTFSFNTMFLITNLVAHNWRWSDIEVHNHIGFKRQP